MKTNGSLLTLAALSAMLITTLHGIEAPPDDATSPLAKQSSSQAPVLGKLPFIGIVSERLPDAVSAQLGLQPNEGVIVRSVMPDGPADTAGILQHDIITRIGEEPLSSPDDLRRLIRNHQPGDTLELGLIRKGRNAAIKVTLTERPNAMANNQDEPIHPLPLDGVPDEMAQRMRDMIEGNLRQFDLPRDGRLPFHGMGLDMDEMFRSMREHMNQLDQLDLPLDDNSSLQMQQSSSIRMLDENGSIELTNQNGIRHLTVRDKDHQTIWSGPWTTDEDKAAAPEDVRKRVDALNIDQSMDDSSFQLRLHRNR